MKTTIRQGPQRGTRPIFLTLGYLLFFAVARVGYAEALDHGLLTDTIQVSGKTIYTWPEGTVRVFEIIGDSRVQQGDVILGSSNAVIWFDELQARTSAVARCQIYTEGGVGLVRGGKTEQYQQLLADFASQAGMTMDGPILTFESAQNNPLYERATAVRRNQKPGFTSTGAVPPGALAKEKPEGPEEVEIFADNMNSWIEGDKRVVVATGHVTIRRGAYEVTAERVVLWVPAEMERGGKMQDFGQVYAEGDVTLSGAQGIVRADQVFEDRVSNRGLMANAEVRTSDPGMKIPFVFRGDEVRQLDERRYVAKNGTITTDPYGKPHFKFKGKMMKLTRGQRADVLSSTDNTFQIGDLPVAYWPFLSKDLRDDSWMLKNVGGGGSSSYGAFFLTEWDLYDLGIYRNDWSTATLRLDGFTKRGVGIGGDFEYVTDYGFGFVKGYYIHDAAEFDSSKLFIEQPDRGRLRWEHRQYLPNDWRFDTELSFLSDRGFLSEYNRQEFAEETPQDTFQYFRRLKDNAGLTLLFQEKINDFEDMTFKPEAGFTPDRQQQKFMADSYLESPLYDTTLQRFPELGYHQIGQPVFGSLFSYSTDTRFDVVDLSYDRQLLRTLPESGTPMLVLPFGDTQVPLQNPPTTARLDTRHDLSAPLDLGPVRVEPMFSTRVQAESTSVEGLDPNNPNSLLEGGATARALAGPQIVASANFWRVYDVHSTLFDVNRLKHIITPQFRYENSAIVTEGPEKLHNFDPYSTVRRIPEVFPFIEETLEPLTPLPTSFNDFSRVETMDHMERVVVELRQRLQTKRGKPGYEETVDLAELRLDYTAFPGSEGLNKEFKDVYGDYIRGDLYWQVAKNVMLEARDNEWDVTTNQVNVANLGVRLEFPPDWTAYVGQRYIRDAREVWTIDPDTDEKTYRGRGSRNVSILGLEYTISPKYAVTFIEQFDWSSNQNNTTKVIVSRKVPGWVIDFVADVDPKDNNTSVSVQLTPLGLSKGARRFW